MHLRTPHHSISNFTPFGHTMLLILIQIGGLGLITLTLFLMSFFIRFGFATQLMAGQLLDLESWKNIKTILFFIVLITLCIETIGTLLIFGSIYKDYALSQAFFLSVFHAVSSFCDAGLSLFPQGYITHKDNFTLLLSVSCIMTFSGLGFLTWFDIMQCMKTFKQRKKNHLTLHSKIVILMTFILITSSVLLYWILERHNTLLSLSMPLGLINALFNGIALRGTGFTTIPIDQLQLATLLLIMIMAFIGSSPGSTGSGIKVTTFAILIATIKSAIKGQTIVTIMGRTIPKDQTYKAMAIIVLGCCWILITTFCLLITEQGMSFLDILFESVSSFATLGLSTGITPYLSSIGKFFIIISMIIGRVGALSLVLAFWKKHENPEFVGGAAGLRPGGASASRRACSTSRRAASGNGRSIRRLRSAPAGPESRSGSRSACAGAGAVRRKILPLCRSAGRSRGRAPASGASRSSAGRRRNASGRVRPPARPAFSIFSVR